MHKVRIMPRKRKNGTIHVGNIMNSTGVAIGHGASVTVNIKRLTLSSRVKESLLIDYRSQVLAETRFVNLIGIPLPRDRNGRFLPLQLPLDKVYIRIQATPEKQRIIREQAEQYRMQNEMRGRHRDILSTMHLLGEYFYRRGEIYQSASRPDPIDPQVALMKHGRFVLLGAPGAGKSTLLRYLTRRAAEDKNGPLPIQISLREYATALSQNSIIRLREFALQMATSDERQRQALSMEID